MCGKEQFYALLQNSIAYNINSMILQRINRIAAIKIGLFNKEVSITVTWDNFRSLYGQF